MIRTVVVDDEPRARSAIRIRLEPEPDFEVVAEAAGGREALAAIDEHRPDLLFLDIKMPDLSGFDVLRRLDPEHVPFVVFVTAYDQFALEAFEVNALAYLLKPFDDIRFDQVLERCRRFFDGAADPDRLVARIQELLEHEARRQQHARPRRLVTRSGTRTRLIDVDAINWIEASGNYARIHTGADRSHLISRSLAQLEDELPDRFVRIHRSTIVNLDRVTELRTENYRDFHVLLDTGETLRMSRTYRETVEAALGDRI